MITERSQISSFAVECAVPVTVNVAQFHGHNGVDEYHLMLCPTQYGDSATQLAWLKRAYREALAVLRLGDESGVVRRFFCSDLPNQAAMLAAEPIADQDDPRTHCAISWVCQPPAPPAKIALWAYHVSDQTGALHKEKDGRSLVLERGELSHRWTTGLTAPIGESSYAQTWDIFTQYTDDLQVRGMSLADHVVRTWLFVQNVDANYHGVVEARKEFFTKHGLTADTHYIASTGIEGRAADVTASVLMDAYAIAGVRDEQIQYLTATDYLCPTHRYGVTFERGVAVAYQDRKHIMISGTASIDHLGNILHIGDVQRQLDRALENVDALLRAADATTDDICMRIVYVRDPSDLAVVRQMLRQRYGDAPVQVVVAPVCRPGWLVEIECLAIAPHCDANLPAF